MNLSPLWVGFFSDRSLEARHWSEVGTPNAPDRDILDFARREGYVVFTHDLDFSRLLALTGASGPSVIQLRSQAVMPDQVGDLVVAAIRQHTYDLERGALITVDTSISRARVLPLRRY